MKFENGKNARIIRELYIPNEREVDFVEFVVLRKTVLNFNKAFLLSDDLEFGIEAKHLIPF